MAGHSQFKNIMYRKGAQDKKRAKQFARLTREIVVAAKSGLPEPDKNPALRGAILAARAANMPKDNIERAIKRVAGGEEDTNYEEVRYEGGKRLARRLELAPEKVVHNIDRVGNTTACSIPLALDETVKAGRIARGDLVCLAAFGAGFTWAGAVCRF